MPATNLTEIIRVTQSDLLASMALEVVTNSEIGAMLPMVSFAGEALVYTREGTPPTSAFVDDVTSAVSSNQGTSDLVTVPVRMLSSDAFITSIADDLSGGREMGRQVVRKARATWRKVEESLITGGFTSSHTLTVTAAPFTAITAMAYGPWLDSNRYGDGEIRYTHSGTKWAFRAPGDNQFGDDVTAATNGVYVLRSFNANKYIVVTLNVASATATGRTAITFASATNSIDGLNRIVSPNMVRASSGANGDAFDSTNGFAILDELMDMEKTRANRAFLCSGRMIRKFLAAQRALGGTMPENVRLPGYSGVTLAYRGVPLLTNDFITPTEAKGTSTTLESIYLASLDADSGLFWGYPSSGTLTTETVVAPDPRVTISAGGWRVENLGPQAGKAERGVRVSLHGNLGLKSSLSLARAKEIQA